MKIKFLSATLLASAVVLAGCSSMSDAGPGIKEGASSLGGKAKEKYEEMRHGSSEAQESGATDAGTASQPADTMTHDHGSHGATEGVVPAEGAVTTEESTWDKTRRKATEAYDNVKEKM